MLGNGKEIDLLAFNPITNERYHIESHVITAKGFRIRLKDTQTKLGIKHKVGLDTLSETKFLNPTVVEGCNKIFGCEAYRRVLVIWDTRESNVVDEAKRLYGIEVWRISDVINELMSEISTKAYRDDILRILQLLSLPNANNRGSIIS